jgi:3-dehydroquinate dehydratase II
MKIAIVNGPNLNLLGQREAKIYGNKTFEAYFSELKEKYSTIQLVYFQSNIEGEIIDFLHDTDKTNVDNVILNAGAYTHTSIAIRDAIAGINTPVIEVHISNLLKRESFRHDSMIGPVVSGSIMGFGIKGYEMAIQSCLIN